MEEEKRVKIEGTVCRIPLKDGSVRRIPLEEFPKKYVCFHNKEGGTIPLERKGAEFLKKCPEGDPISIAFQGEVKDFIDEVLRWGLKEDEYNTVIGYLYSSEQPDEVVARKVHEAATALQNGKLGDAVQTLDGLTGIGISVGSKILRIMSPEKAGVLDSILQNKLLYDANGTGYACFCKSCGEVADRLNADGIKHESPIVQLRGSDEWFIADVEAVVYDCLRG